MENYEKEFKKLDERLINIINRKNTTDEYECQFQNPQSCPMCQSNRIVLNNCYKKDLLDIISEGPHKRAVNLCIFYNYYQCLNKIHRKKFFFPSSLGLSWKKRPYTCRFELYVFMKCLYTEAKRIACGKVINGKIDPHDVIGIFLHITNLLDSFLPKRIAPIITMEIHKTVIKGVTLYVICDIEKGVLVDILTNCKSDTLLAFSKRMDLSALKTIWIDIDDQLLDSVSAVFPDAIICTGKREIHRYFSNRIRTYQKASDSHNYMENMRRNYAIIQALKFDYKKSWTNTDECDRWISYAIMMFPDEIVEKVTIFKFIDCIQNSINRYYYDHEGYDLKDITDDILESIDSRIGELRKTRGAIIRSRALYGSIILDSRDFSLLEEAKNSVKESIFNLSRKTVSSIYNIRIPTAYNTFSAEQLLKRVIGDSFIIIPKMKGDIQLSENRLDGNMNYHYYLEEIRIRGEDYSEYENECWLVGQPLQEVEKRMTAFTEAIKTAGFEEKLD